MSTRVRCDFCGQYYGSDGFDERCPRCRGNGEQVERVVMKMNPEVMFLEQQQYELIDQEEKLRKQIAELRKKELELENKKLDTIDKIFPKGWTGWKDKDWDELINSLEPPLEASGSDN